MRSPVRLVRCRHMQRELDRLAGQIGRLRVAAPDGFAGREGLYRKHARLTRKHKGLS